MSGSIERVAFQVDGRVQGVGFRWFVVRNAERLGLSGWVRNRDDGAVEGEAQGASAALADFLAAIGRGPSLARVGEVRTSPRAPQQGAVGFSVR